MRICSNMAKQQIHMIGCITLLWPILWHNTQRNTLKCHTLKSKAVKSNTLKSNTEKLHSQKLHSQKLHSQK